MQEVNGWIEWRDLSPWAQNPNQHGTFDLAAIAESIRAFGFVAPMVLDPSVGQLVAGHGRLEAMALIEKGYDYIDSSGDIQTRPPEPEFQPEGAPAPGFVRVVEHVFKTEAKRNAYAIADNKLAEASSLDLDSVKELLSDITSDEAFTSLHAIGYPSNELQALISNGASASDFLNGLSNPPAEDSLGAQEPGEPKITGSVKTTETIVDLVIPMSVSERAWCHGVVNLAKRLTGVTTTREAVLVIFKKYESEQESA